ncbi:3'(2'),5'-bisphosphate nucleotidase CysQ [Robiginitalea sp. IMCC43444]|uniref:3'(2'),5'-bisphosphate nucleotidase CysQ n=1 Tax=Robiginitalea sp. IMCC43444 TaxID=3459121 RepID=UPI004041F76C
MKISTLTALQAALSAGKAILNYYNEDDYELGYKEDNTPLTSADLAANTIITEALGKTGIPIISEESPKVPYLERKDWEQCWIVDPLDGTKEFVGRNGEFTVNIALCRLGKPVLGVIYVPLSRELYLGDVEVKAAYKHTLGEGHQLPNEPFAPQHRIYAAKTDTSVLRVLCSRSFRDPQTEAYIRDLQKKHKRVEIIPKGSSIKFCWMAEGKADLYPRFSSIMEWDTAAGQAICEAAGLSVRNIDNGSPIRYNKEDLRTPGFIVSSNDASNSTHP